MCLHGTATSGHVHRMASSRELAGKSGAPAAAKTSSSSPGSSPASSWARYRACEASALSTACQASSPSTANPMLTWYGCGREPWTVELTAPGRTVSVSTCPLRAYVRPRGSRPPIDRDSSTATKRRDPHVEPIAPRSDRATRPPSTRIGRAPRSPQSCQPLLTCLLSRTEPPAVTLCTASWGEGADGARPREAADGAPPREAVDGAPPREAVDGAPPREAVDGAPPREAVDGAPPREAVDGAPPREAADGAPPREAVHSVVDGCPRTAAGAVHPGRSPPRSLGDGDRGVE